MSFAHGEKKASGNLGAIDQEVHIFMHGVQNFRLARGSPLRVLRLNPSPRFFPTSNRFADLAQPEHGTRHRYADDPILSTQRYGGKRSSHERQVDRRDVQSK